MLFFQLPEDVLYHILSYLDYKSLSRLSQVCKSTYQFVNRDAVWRNVAKDFLNTGITRNGTDKPVLIVAILSLRVIAPGKHLESLTSYGHIPLKKRVKIAQNWYDGICKRATPLKWKTKLLPWLQLDGDMLFLSQAGDIGAYNLHQASRKCSCKPSEIYSGHKGDVCRFALTESHLISGGSDGKILVYNRGNCKSVEFSGHKQEVNCIDSKNGLIISGSRDQTTRIWTLTSTYPRETIHMNDRVWSVAINPSLSSFITGTACCENFSPLKIWDVERLECVCSLGSQFRRGAGVLDMVFETPSQLLTCGYDTFVRMWDLRLNPRKCVKEWEEPHDCALYCIQTDGNHMIASGSSYYGVVRFWDKRQSKCLQYFQLCAHPVTSPVYCLRFSSSHLYAALANTLETLDFS